MAFVALRNKEGRFDWRMFSVLAKGNSQQLRRPYPVIPVGMYLNHGPGGGIAQLFGENENYG